MNVYIWLAIFVISVIAEVSTAGLVAIWFAPASLICMLLAHLKVSATMQIIAFIVLSGIFMLLFYKKICDNIRNKSEKTNLDAIIGKEGVVEEDIPPRGVGRIKVGGISWAAYTDDRENTVKKGEYVKVLDIDGVKLLCKPVSESGSDEKEKSAALSE